MVRSLFRNSNRKLRSTFWGSPFIPVGTNQTECCLPLTNFSVPSRFQTHATQIRPFLDSNRNGCGISTVNWQIAYHYAFATPTGFFCQMVSTLGLRAPLVVRKKKKKKIQNVLEFANLSESICTGSRLFRNSNLLTAHEHVANSYIVPSLYIFFFSLY